MMVLILGWGVLFSACSKHNTEAIRVSSEIRRSLNPSGVVKEFLAALVQKNEYILSQSTVDKSVYRDPAWQARLLEVARHSHRAKWQEHFQAEGKAIVSLIYQKQNGTMVENSFTLAEVPRGKNSVYSWKIERFNE